MRTITAYQPGPTGVTRVEIPLTLDILRAAGPVMIDRRRILERLDTNAAAFIDALRADVVQYELWQASQGIDYDDATIRALIAGVGADPDYVMLPPELEP